MSKAVIFPEYVDTLPQFLFLESDDISIFIFGMIVGVILQYASRSPVGMMAGIVLGMAVLPVRQIQAQHLARYTGTHGVRFNRPIPA